MTREERKRDRRVEIAFSALCLLAAMALLCVDACAAWVPEIDPEEIKTGLSVVGAWCVAAGAIRVLDLMERYE